MEAVLARTGLATSSNEVEKRIAGTGQFLHRYSAAGTSVNLRRIRLALREKIGAEVLEYVNHQNGASTLSSQARPCPG